MFFYHIDVSMIAYYYKVVRFHIFDNQEEPSHAVRSVLSQTTEMNKKQIQ